MMDGTRSAADDVPPLLLGLGTDAWPAVLLVGKQIACALDVGNDVGSSSLESLGAGNDGSLDVDGALDLEGLGAISIIVEIVEGGLAFEVGEFLFGLERVESEGGEDSDEGKERVLLHGRINYVDIGEYICWLSSQAMNAAV